MIGYRLTIVAALLVAGAAALPATAAPVPSQAASPTAAQADVAAMAAERALLQAQLTGYGLAERAAAGRMALLTDEEVHAIVADPDALRVVAGDFFEEAGYVLFVVVLIGGLWHEWTHG